MWRGCENGAEPVAVIGHNGGPGLQAGQICNRGQAWRAHCWRHARASLLPTLPLEVVRLRVQRARDLGLDYKTYASVRAATGHDLVAFLFSSNALRLARQRVNLPVERAEKLAAMACVRIALASAPLAPSQVLVNPQIDAAHAAPFALAKFATARADIRAALGRTPGDRVLLIGDMAVERDWCDAGRLAGYLSAEVFFGTSPG